MNLNFSHINDYTPSLDFKPHLVWIWPKKEEEKRVHTVNSNDINPNKVENQLTWYTDDASC